MLVLSDLGVQQTRAIWQTLAILAIVLAITSPSLACTENRRCYAPL